MAVTTIARSHEGNLGFLEVMMEREMFRKMFWARFAGFVTQDDRGRDLPPESPLVVKRELAREGFDFLKIPMLRKLTNAPKYGDVQLEGNAEAQSIYFLDAYINQIRHGVAPPPRMQNQRVKRFNLASRARPQLEDYFAEDIEIQIASAFYESYSRNLTASAANGGYAFTAVPHPAIYTADAGRVTFNATVATYEASIQTAVNNLTDTSSDYMSTDALESLRVEVLKRQIQPITVNGMETWPVLCHYNQAKQLRTNTAWQQAQREAGVRALMANPIFSGALGHYAGFTLFERELGCFGVDVSSGAGSFVWGATNPHNAVDTLNHKAAIVFGKNSMCMAWAEGPFFEEDTFDLNNRKEIAAGLIAGFKRADFEDATGTPTAVINQTSALLITYSPDGWS
jgi:hypothetical protein